MLVFTSLDGAQVAPCFTYTDYERVEELNGSLQISFTVPKAADNSAAFSILDYETTVEDEDGHLYVVKQIKSTHTRKIVTAVHKFFTLSDIFVHDTIGGTLTVQALLDRIFSGTGFTPTASPSLATRTVTLTNVGGDNVTALLEDVCDLLGIERKITSSNSVYFADQIGADAGAVFKYAHNIRTLSYDVDTTDIKTVIRGLSSEIPGATVYTSPNAAIFGLREAAPIEDNSIVTTEFMIDRLRSEINDEPKISIAVDVLTFDGEVGDNVLLLHEPLGLDIQTRVLEKTTRRGSVISSITIGNTKQPSLSDLFMQQEEQIRTNERYTRSRFEQTRDLIALEVEAVGEEIATLEIRANSITQSVADLEEDVDSKITQTAAAIRAELQSQATSTTNTLEELGGQITTNTENIASLQITATNLTSSISQQNTSISNLGTRVSTAESTVSQFANEIDARVKTTDFTGNTIISKINLSSTTATIQASRINLVGAVTVLSSITGNLGTITAGTLNSVNINSANIDITDDVKIGDKLYLNGGSNGGIYFDRYGWLGKIFTDSATMHLVADNMVLNTMYGLNIVTGNGAWVDGDQIVTSRTDGLTFGYNSTNKRLYVTINGTDVAYIACTGL